MAEQSIGMRVQSTTQTVSQASKFSRQAPLAGKASSITSPTAMGASAALMTASPRGVLKQTNVGDVKSSVDTVSRETQKSVAAVKQNIEAATQKFSQQLTDKGSAVTKTL